MKKSVMICTVLVGVSCLGLGRVIAGDISEALGSISMVSINKMKVLETNDQYIMQTELTLLNKSQNEVKFRNGEFETSVELTEKSPAGTDKKTVIVLGKTGTDQFITTIIETQAGKGRDTIRTEKDIVIPGATNKKTPGVASVETRIILGPKNAETITKLIGLWAVVGDPKIPMVMLLNGTAELGVKLENGWLFEKDKKYEVQLKFIPSIEKSVLIR